MLFISGYLRDSNHEPSKIVRVARDGKVLDVLVGSTDLGEGFALSTDGNQLAVVRDGALWIHDLERATRLKLPTGDAHSPEKPLWSLDGDRIVFTATKDADLFIQYTDGRRLPELLLSLDGEQHAFSWEPNGEALALTSSYGSENGILILPMNGGEPRRLIPAEGLLTQPMISPDGRWIAYQTDSSGRAEVFLQSFPELGRKVPVSVEGGTDPLWSKDGSEVFFRNGSSMMTVSIQLQPDLRLSPPTMLFEADDMRYVCLDADGDAFLVRTRDPDSGIQTDLHIILNWLEELSVKVPTGASK